LIASALQAYYLTTGEFPTTEQGLRALVERPDELATDIEWKQILGNIPKDQWGRQYQYILSSIDDEPIFEIRSLGIDEVKSDDDYIAVFNKHSREIR